MNFTSPYNLFAEVANLPIGLVNTSVKVFNGLAQQAGFSGLKIQFQVPFVNKARPFDKLTQKQPDWIRSVDNKKFLEEAKKQNIAINPLYELKNVVVVDRDGKEVAISSLVQGKVYIAILRHLGCTFCWDFARQLQQILPQFEKQGFKLIMLSLGSDKQISHLEDSLDLPKHSVFVDRDLKVYPALGFYGPSQFFSTDVFKVFSKYDWNYFFQSMRKYEFHAPPRTTDVMQLGGNLIVDGPKVIYARRDEAVGDHPDLNDIIDHMKIYNGKL